MYMYMYMYILIHSLLLYTSCTMLQCIPYYHVITRLSVLRKSIHDVFAGISAKWRATLTSLWIVRTPPTMTLTKKDKDEVPIAYMYMYM